MYYAKFSRNTKPSTRKRPGTRRNKRHPYASKEIGYGSAGPTGKSEPRRPD